MLHRRWPGTYDAAQPVASPDPKGLAALGPGELGVGHLRKGASTGVAEMQIGALSCTMNSNEIVLTHSVTSAHFTPGSYGLFRDGLELEKSLGGNIDR